MSIRTSIDLSIQAPARLYPGKPTPSLSSRTYGMHRRVDFGRSTMTSIAGAFTLPPCRAVCVPQREDGQLVGEAVCRLQRIRAPSTHRSRRRRLHRHCLRPLLSLVVALPMSLSWGGGMLSAPPGRALPTSAVRLLARQTITYISNPRAQIPTTACGSSPGVNRIPAWPAG